MMDAGASLSSNSYVANSGSIDGGVSFTTGRNKFNGRGGTVSGTVQGGNRADALVAGDGATTLAGGFGHDLLYAGTGADTFAFDEYGPANSDNIHGFKPSTDLIQLDSTVFTALTAGQTPEFSTGTQASDATDHLFYNASSGALFYQQDSSHAASLVATLIGAPTITASNIKVV